MLDSFPMMPVPDWLADIDAQKMEDAPFPLSQVLEGSLYYPASGFDGDPVKYLAGNFLSFIYVDYGRSHDELVEAVHCPGFRGYEVVATRPVTEKELTPKGWKPLPPSNTDGDPSRYRGWIKAPFCSWSIFQRSDDVPASHGPFRFSLLYLSADGVAAFQALYHGNGVSPRAVAVIQPGHGFGGNWTNFKDDKKIFARSVLGNQYGKPQVLLCGGIGKREFYREPCWAKYGRLVCFLDKTGGGTIGVWVQDESG